MTTEAPHIALEHLLIELDGGAVIVAEKGPTNHRRQADACAPVEALITRLANHVHWVRPTDWKLHPSANLVLGDAPATRHERDAIQMGRWFLARRGTPDGTQARAS
jgi:hypothetical protein